MSSARNPHFAMAEIGLVQFARVALDVAQATVPRYRTTFSKHQITQPQLLAILCVTRYEDWTYREAEVRLAEHGELRCALQLASVPDYTTWYRFLRRLDEAAITRALNEVVHRMPLRGPRRRSQVAVDATGLSPGAISTFFVRRMYHHNQQPMPWRHWLKWLVAVDLDRQLVLAQKAHAGPTNDGANLRPLVDAAHTVSAIGLVLADAEFDSELNHTHIRQQLGACSIIPAKRGKKTWCIHRVRAKMRDHFPRRLYRRRALIETVFSAAKRKLSCRAPGGCLLTQRRHALLLGLTYNVYRL
jgi:DDE family transposase